MMECDTGSPRNWTASVEDLLAFVDRASKSVTAALKRPAKPKGHLNLRRYIQKRLNRNQDYVRDRTPATNSKKIRTSKSSIPSSAVSSPQRAVPTFQDAEPSHQADFTFNDIFCSVIPSENYSWNPNPSLLYGYNDDSWSAAGNAQPGGHAETKEASICSGGNDDMFYTTFMCQDGPYTRVSSDNGGCCMSTWNTPSRQDTNVDHGSVDPIFPPENCDKIVPLITDTPFVGHDTGDLAASATEAHGFQLNSCMLEREPRPLESEFSIRSASFFPFSPVSHSMVSIVSNGE